MEIILKQDVNNLGHKDDIVKVKDGYARNFLIPQKMAVAATESNLKMHKETVKQREHKEVKLREEATAIAEKLNGITLTVGAKTSSTGKVFGSVNNIQVAEALEKAGYKIDRKNIYMKEDHIKEVGNYSAKVKIYKDISVEIPFEVVSE